MALSTCKTAHSCPRMAACYVGQKWVRLMCACYSVT